MITCVPVTGLPEVRDGDDLTALVLEAAELRDGDVLVVTSKVVSKAEGRVVAASRADVVDAETDRVVARRGGTTIVRTRHGLVMAAAGIDASNTAPGTVVLLPVDPDASARRLREALAGRTGKNVAVVISDTSGRAWRLGQTDIAVGAAGLEVLDDHAGREDGYGNLLAVTAPALADEMAGVADLATGKLSRSPAAVLRGLARLVLPVGEHGSGAAALVRPDAQDLFGLGSREAVLHAVARRDPRGFGAPADAGELTRALSQVMGTACDETRHDEAVVEVTLPSLADAGERALGALGERASVTAFALGWRLDGEPQSGPGGTRVRFVPVTP